MKTEYSNEKQEKFIKNLLDKYRGTEKETEIRKILERIQDSSKGILKNTQKMIDFSEEMDSLQMDIKKANAIKLGVVQSVVVSLVLNNLNEREYLELNEYIKNHEELRKW